MVEHRIISFIIIRYIYDICGILIPFILLLGQTERNCELCFVNYALGGLISSISCQNGNGYSHNDENNNNDNINKNNNDNYDNRNNNNDDNNDDMIIMIIMIIMKIIIITVISFAFVWCSDIILYIKLSVQLLRVTTTSKEIGVQRYAYMTYWAILYIWY